MQGSVSETNSEITYAEVSIPPNVVDEGSSILVGQLQSEEYDNSTFVEPKLANLSLVPNMRMGNFSFVATVLQDGRSSNDENFAFSSPVTLTFLIDPQEMLGAYPTDDKQLRRAAPALLLRN
eukprot:3680169-Rhodomonas_salina.1